jgi:hypothetical protein
MQDKNQTSPGPGAYQITKDTLGNRSIIKYTEGIMALHIQKNREEQQRLKDTYTKRRKEAALAEMNLMEIEKAQKEQRAEAGSPGPGAYDKEIKPAVK